MQTLSAQVLVCLRNPAFVFTAHNPLNIELYYWIGHTCSITMHTVFPSDEGGGGTKNTERTTKVDAMFCNQLQKP